ncbi:YtfJ family protein [Candidatus Symbiopectobacterium sp. NZEC151]|uniref:YtfJ family protein n=1 Tax=Candidatus Symbiopectobacterium sp. NZEC151 TaxID=2820470 RepID=UPI0022265086|nr:YtfJ family protein [Candidatus Symbiopectobacterium sp. NZEC151]MCW2476242.1 YtfJ family protein [Candidatus Symbiopectobacterium sp. NZEC151]
MTACHTSTLRLRIALFSLCTLLALPGMAHNLTLNNTLPPTGVADKGELMYQNQQFSYQNWNSAQLAGKVRVIQHIAGRTSAKEMNDPLISAIKAANLAREYYQTTTIVNTDDAIIGTSPFVRSSLEESKKTFPWSQFIVDSNGNVRKAWQLEPKSSAIVVLDKRGQVRYVKDGALSAQDVQQVMGLLPQLLKE